MKKNLTLRFLFLFFLFGEFVQAQQPSALRFDHFTVTEGLSQSQAYCFLQDSRGYLWIGTQDGLNRFDGSEFKVFKNDPFDSTTLTHNWVWSIAEDNHGDLWIGTFQGLCKYVRQEDRFVQYYHHLADTTSISGNRTNFVVKDKKGRLWISAWGNGINLYDEKTNSFKRFNNSVNENSLSDNSVRTFFCDSRGTLWVGTWNGGLNRVVEDDQGIRFQRYSGLNESGLGSGNRITSIVEDRSGTLWIGNYESGLIKYIPSLNKFERVPGFMPNDVNKIAFDSHENLWVGTNNGIRVLNIQTHEVTSYFHDPSIPSSPSSNTIYVVYKDRMGNMWIAGNGLDKYDPDKNLFQTFQSKPGDRYSLQDNHITTLYEADKREIWIGAESGPVMIFNPANNSFRPIKIQDNRGNLATNVHSIAQDGDIFWLASFNAGLVRYDRKTGTSKFFHGSHPSILGSIVFVNEVLLDVDHTVWIGTYENGLLHYDPRTDHLEQFRASATDPESIGSNFLRSLYTDNKGNLWIGFWGGGLSMLNKKTMKFKNYSYDRKNKSGLSDQGVSSVLQHDDSIFFICTHTGLNKLNVNTGEFKHFFEKDGLANNVTYEMLLDEQGDYWISTNGGISRFNPVTLTFKNYTAEDGLQSNEFNSKAALKSSTGEFYFGGVNGFNVFRPERITENKTPPALTLQSFSIFDQSFIPQDFVQLKHDQNYITFHFAALEFSAPEKIRYAYVLEGLDPDWKEAVNKREAHYTDLDPGHYTFRVKASNPDGYWTESNFPSMTIEILPPFWQTWWFTALVLLLSAGLIYAAHRYRLNQSLKVERLRNKIAGDLHDEVGSSLTRISIYSDLVQNGSDEKESKNYLKGISDLSREVVLTMSDIVWSIDNRYDTFEALTLRMKDFANEVLQAKNINFDFEAKGIDPQRMLDPVLKQNLYLIFKEAINNIVKHACARNVTATLLADHGKLELRIIDDGKGLPSGEITRGNGLRNMMRRAKAIGGEINIQGGNGTSIVVTKRL